MNQEILYNAFLLTVYLLPLTVLFGVGAYFADRWDESGLSFKDWLLYRWRS